MMGAVAPIVTGFIVGVTGSFAGAFLVAGIALVIGIFAYVVLLRRIEPIAEMKARHVHPTSVPD